VDKSGLVASSLCRRFLSSGLAGFSSGVARLATGVSAAWKVDSRPRALVVLVIVEGFWYFDFQSALAGVLARLIILSPVITNASKFFLLFPLSSLESESLLPELELPSLLRGRNGSLDVD
jgi:hypothetical protein